MRKQTRRRLSWPAVGALAFVVGAPTLAHAQQSGLFPLAPIRRERTPCAMEDPVYKLYRHEYFGYHPTCWRKFPQGWGCPSPEAPDADKEFKILPRDKPRDEATEGDDTGNEAAPGGAQPTARPNRGTPPGATQPGGTGPPLPSDPRSPFEVDPKPNGKPSTTTPPVVTPPATRPAAPGGNPVMPTLPGDTTPVTPVPSTPGPSADAGASPAPDRHGDDPLLALPDPTVGPSSTVSSNNPPLPNTSGAGSSASDTANTSTDTPAQAPQRRGLLSRLFGGGLLRR